MPVPPQSAATTPSPTLVDGLRAGIQAAQRSLDQLFAPYTVTVTTVEGWPLALPLIESDESSGRPSAIHLGAAFDVEGPIKARLLMLAGEGDDAKLTATLLRRAPSADGALDAEDRAALSEMANIVASSFLNGLARALKLRLLPSVPSLEESPLQDVLQAVRAAHGWVIGAQFTVALPSGAASGLFVAAPVLESPGA